MAEPQSRSRLKRRRQSHQAIRSPQLGAILQLQGEFTRSCFAIVCVGSILNALVSGANCKIRPCSVEGYLPGQPLLGPQLARDLILAGAGDELGRGALAVGNQLQLCSDLVRGFARSASDSNEAMEPVSDAWRRLAHASFVLEYMIDYALESAGSAAAATSPRSFATLLKEIGQGHHPCIDELGILALPGWAERRRTSRTEMPEVPAIIELLGQRIQVRIINVSPTGVGLRGIDGLIEGDRFALYCGNLPAIDCTVTWSEKGRVGASFVSPLHPLDISAIEHTSASR